MSASAKSNQSEPPPISKSKDRLSDMPLPPKPILQAPPAYQKTTTLALSPSSRNSLPTLQQHIDSFPFDLRSRLRLYKSYKIHTTLFWDLVRNSEAVGDGDGLIAIRGVESARWPVATIIVLSDFPCRYCEHLPSRSSNTGRGRNGQHCFDIFNELDGLDELKGVVALLKKPTNEILYRQYWNQSTIAADGQFEFYAIYSDETVPRSKYHPYIDAIERFVSDIICCKACCSACCKVPRHDRQMYIEDLNLDEFIVHK